MDVDLVQVEQAGADQGDEDVEGSRPVHEVPDHFPVMGRRRWAALKAERAVRSVQAPGGFRHADGAATAVDRGSGRAPATVEEELAGFLNRTFAALQKSRSGVRGLMAWAQQDVAFRANFRERFIAPRRAMLRSILARALQDHGPSAERALDAAVIALYGAVWYRLLLDEPFDARFGAGLARVMLGGLAPDRR